MVRPHGIIDGVKGKAVVSRFAPSPTGRLHLGHVVNAIVVWGVTRALGGRVMLRIEDHDRQRSRPEFERAILDDLEWLGFSPDDPPVRAFRDGACDGRQSDRTACYEAALDRLRAQGRVYACDCSRRTVGRADRRDAADADEAAGPAGVEVPYPGTCRRRGLAELGGRGLRVRLDDVEESFDDLRHGRQRQQPSAQCGDLLVRDRAGNWTYQFAATADDADLGVTLVIRGDDLLASTGRQIQLARLLGRAAPPAFLHHPLIMKAAGQKLSKADGDTSIRDLRAAGHAPAAVIGRAASLAGLAPGDHELLASAVPGLPAIVRFAERAER